jgi:hypothetical protein
VGILVDWSPCSLRLSRHHVNSRYFLERIGHNNIHAHVYAVFMDWLLEWVLSMLSVDGAIQ